MTGALMNDVTMGLLLDNIIGVWTSIPAFAPLSEIVRRDRRLLESQMTRLLIFPTYGTEMDLARSHILTHAILNYEHFINFNRPETTPLVGKDFLEFISGIEAHVFRDPFPGEVITIVAEGLFAGGRMDIPSKDIISFYQFIFGALTTSPDEDFVVLFKSMVWFSCLLLELARIDHQNVCSVGLVYFERKFKELMNWATGDGSLAHEESTWAKTLFSWLKGESMERLVVKLKMQFNLDNGQTGAGFLQAEHRERMFRAALTRICRSKKRV